MVGHTQLFRNIIKLFIAVFAASVLSISTSVLAAEDIIEEIIVIAQKREQSLKDVPISMTVLDEESLELRGFDSFDDIAFAAPNLSITDPVGARTVQFTMRGITGQTFFPGAESAVGIFLDGVYVNNPAAQNFDLMDVERIEVLRGPQGTLYGKNAAAGAINVISRKPDEEAIGEVLAEYGNYDHRRIRLKASGPLKLSDSVYGSIGINRYKRDGFQDNTFDGSEFDDEDSWSVRAAVRYVGDRTEVNFAVEAMQEDRTPAVLDNTPDDRDSALNNPVFQERDIIGGNLTIDYELPDGILLTSTTAVRDYELDRGQDDDGTPMDAFFSSGFQTTKQISQELRLASTSDSPFQWLLGAYYLDTDMKDEGTNNFFPDPLFQLLTGLTCTDLFTFQFIAAGFDPVTAATIAAASCAPASADTRADHESETLALFGQASYAFTDTLNFTVGLRTSREEKDFRLRQPGPGGAPFILAGIDESYDRDDTTVDPMASLVWQATDTTNLYATVARGSKSGGFNTGAAADPNQLAQTEFDEETLLNYELGVKSVTWNGRLSINTAAFYIDYEDLQVFRIEANAQGVPSARITNVAEATSWGVELDFIALLSDSLTLRGGLGYLDAQYDDYSQCGQDSAGMLIDCTDNNLTNAPEWTANLNLLYTRPINSGVNFIVNSELSYRGDVYYDVFNTDGAFQDGFAVFNANIGFVDADDKWSVLLWGTNLADEEYITIGIQGFGGLAINTLGPPRQYGIRVTWRP